MVAPQGDLVTQRTGQVAGTGDGMAALVVHALIVVFQVLPQLGLFFKSLRAAIHRQEHAGDCHHHGQIVEHVGAQLFLAFRQSIQIHRVDHDLGHAQLLVHALDHHALIHALVITANKVTVQVNIHIVQTLAERQRLVDEHVINIEGMLGQLQAAVTQDLGAVDDGVHQNVLARREMADLIPGKHTVLRQNTLVADGVVGVIHHMLVHIVAHQQVHRLLHGGKTAQGLHDLLQSFGIQPVVRVHDFEVHTACVADALVDTLAMATVFLVDDLDDDELCRNEKRVKDLTDWVKEALFGALDVGRGRFMMVGNLISKCSVLANMCATRGVYVSEIKAVDKNGNPVWKEKWTREEAQAYADFVGYRAWNKEMMHNPINDGSIFRHEWIRYKRLPKLEKYDMLVCYTDPSFKSTTANDYKACRLWGKIGTELHLIDCYVRQDTVSGMVRWLYDLYERTRDRVSISFFMEANFMQDIILDEFAAEGNIRGYQLPILPDKRSKPEKIQRIEAISPLWERGFIFYNEALKDSPDMQVGIEQTLALERGSRVHDDAPDADEGAIWYLQRNTRQEIFKPVAIPRRSPKNMW